MEGLVAELLNSDGIKGNSVLSRLSSKAIEKVILPCLAMLNHNEVAQQLFEDIVNATNLQSK